MTDKPENDSVRPSSLPRREFIKVSATGLTAFVAVDAAGRPLVQEAPQEVRPIPADGVVDPAAIEIETWQEPWVWRPSDWSGSALNLDVVRSQNYGPSPSSGNVVPSLFSYGGTSPGPTIRARGDEVIRLAVRNHLGTNRQATPVGPFADVFELVPPDDEELCRMVAASEGGVPDPMDPEYCFIGFPFLHQEIAYPWASARLVPGYAMLHHANGQATAHVTNIHTHGLHVSPDINPNGSVSDNVLLRLLPRGDWAERQASGDPALAELGDHERVGEAAYELHLGGAGHGAPEGSPAVPHPPGTHWYHPHAHGSTHDQVSSGMAGFIIVEGDVDDAINLRMTGDERPDPTLRSGPFDYRERLMLVQRVFVNSLDLDDARQRREMRFPPLTAVNGAAQPGIFDMRPGAVERWRVLNGAVDGSGFKRFMVLEGQFVHRQGRLWRVDDGGTERRLVPVSRAEVDAAKLPLYLLAFDGITLVREEGEGARHFIKDLSRQNAGTANPMAGEPRGGEDEVHTTLRNIESCFRDGDSLRRCFNRPNEVYLGNANRADVFFKAPTDGAGKVLTVLAQEVEVATDNKQQLMQMTIRLGEPFVNRPPLDVVAAYIYVGGDPVDGGDFDVMSLEADLPPVPPFLRPVSRDELQIPATEAATRAVRPGSHRTRVLSYSGTGGTDWPLIRVPEAFVRAHPDLERVVWSRYGGVDLLLPNYTRSMAINPDFDLAARTDPGPPRKFAPDDPERVRTLVGTAEEWVVYNCSQMLWSHTDTERFPQPGQYKLHYESYPVARAEGQRRFWEDHEFHVTTKGSDHPFHIHVNPIWVTRIDMPDEQGQLHNVLEEPRWMDTVPIPRNGGRVVFRTRFLDFVGKWVNHCHILLHEDNGMMSLMECTDEPESVNYRPREQVAEFDMPAARVDEIYPRPSPELMYKQNLSFVDPNPETGQVYPGFELEVPRLED